MAVTPRGIVTPNASDDYDLIVDLAAMANSTDTAIGTVATASTNASNLTSGTVNAARIPNLEDLNGTLDVASGGTGATTLAAVQESFRIGLIPISPTSVTPSAGTATATTLGLVSVGGSNTTNFNGTFSSTYARYRIILSNLILSTAADVFIRLRSGTTDSSAGYYYNNLNITNVTLTGESGIGATAGFPCGISGTTGGGVGSAEIEIYNPANASLRTNYSSHYSGYTTQPIQKLVRGFHDVSAAYTGFTVYATNSATMTYSLQVFGYND